MHNEMTTRKTVCESQKLILENLNNTLFRLSLRD